MENFLPALFIIGAVIYKIYTEYQKEQEKARRRMPQAPQSKPPVPPEHQPRRTVIEPTTAVPLPIPHQKTKYAPDIPDEVRKLREQKQQKATHAKKIVVELEKEIESEKEASISFDLREAVIQSAILNKPY